MTAPDQIAALRKALEEIRLRDKRTRFTEADIEQEYDGPFGSIAAEALAATSAQPSGGILRWERPQPGRSCVYHFAEPAIHQIGDAVVIWVNEGDLLRFEQECAAQPSGAVQRKYGPGCRQEQPSGGTADAEDG